MRRPRTAAGPKGKHRIKFPIHPFHAGKAKQRRQRKRPRLHMGNARENPSGSGRYSARPPPAARASRGSPIRRVGASSQCQPSGECGPPGEPAEKASSARAPVGGQAPCRRSSSRERVRLSFSRPSSGRKRLPMRPGLPSRRGNLYRAPFRPRAALPRTAPGRRSPRRSASPVRRPVKTAPHKRPPSPPFPSILCGAGGEMRCKTVDRSADACYTVCDLKTIGAGKMRK